MLTAKHQLRSVAVDALEHLLPYTAYSIDEKEYLGRFDGTLNEFAENLRERGYHYQLFAAEKTLTEDGVKDDGSWARIPDHHPSEAEGTALEERDARELQYHAHPFEVDGTVEVYGHIEIHPYPHTPHWDSSRPWPDHYRPTWDRPNEDKEDWTYLRGVVDSRIEPLLE